MKNIVLLSFLVFSACSSQSASRGPDGESGFEPGFFVSPRAERAETCGSKCISGDPNGNNCIELGEERRVCRCNGVAGGHLTFLSGRQELCSMSMSNFDSRTDTYQAATADLDRDGAQELVVLSLAGVSKDNSTTRWDVYIWKFKKPCDKPVHFVAQDAGWDMFHYDERQQLYSILIPSWENVRDRSGKTTRMFVGRFFNYSNGQLVSGDEAGVARAYSSELEEERSASNLFGEDQEANLGGEPFKWLIGDGSDK